MLLLVMLVAMSNHSMNLIVRLISAMMFRMIMILEVILALSNNYFRLDKKTASIVRKI